MSHNQASTQSVLLPGSRPRVIVIGAGFGGLRVARSLAGAPVDVLLIDRHNYHQFQPLLYEVAAAGLEPDDIAQPVRAILRGTRNVRFLMADVTGVDLAAKNVTTAAGEIPYDFLVVAAGSATNYFGLQSVELRALGLKDLHQATAVRNRILRNFERAVIATNDAERERLMSVVVIGGGPTGVELSGALAELKRHVLPRDYPDLDLERAHVILLEATDRLLPSMPARLQRKAAQQLRALGVDVRFNAAVREVTADSVVLASGETIASASVVWVAGVRGEPLGETLSAEMGAQRRIKVLPTLQVPGHLDAFVIGDLAYLEDSHGRAYPMVAPVAIQQAQVAATNIMRELRGEPLRAFAYKDRGQMATIGRRKAVAQVFGLQFSGFIAWALWLFVHLIQIVGLRNRALVLLNWTWNYFRYDRANRLVTDRELIDPERDADLAALDEPEHADARR
ncbi:MAG: NAD(P)/FAD-dependent oxidoreductase [Dehalococcoidia bacterium]